MCGWGGGGAEGVGGSRGRWPRITSASRHIMGHFRTGKGPDMTLCQTIPTPSRSRPGPQYKILCFYTDFETSTFFTFICI